MSVTRASFHIINKTLEGVTPSNFKCWKRIHLNIYFIWNFELFSILNQWNNLILSEYKIRATLKWFVMKSILIEMELKTSANEAVLRPSMQLMHFAIKWCRFVANSNYNIITMQHICTLHKWNTLFLFILMHRYWLAWTKKKKNFR